jgi:hypothetical protein
VAERGGGGGRGGRRRLRSADVAERGGATCEQGERGEMEEEGQGRWPGLSLILPATCPVAVASGERRGRALSTAAVTRGEGAGEEDCARGLGRAGPAPGKWPLAFSLLFLFCFLFIY